MRYWYADILAELRVNWRKRHIPCEVVVFCEKAQRDRYCDEHENTYPCESAYARVFIWKWVSEYYGIKYCEVRNMGQTEVISRYLISLLYSDLGSG